VNLSCTCLKIKTPAVQKPNAGGTAITGGKYLEELYEYESNRIRKNKEHRKIIINYRP
jgi:hypothetical protein